MIKLIEGGIVQDQRGQISFVNDFDMSQVKRFYIIENANTELVRGWRGHRIEQRWFYVMSGIFELDLIQIDNWDSPSVDLPVEKIILSSKDIQVLHIPVGYCTAFRALEDDSKLLVFADSGIKNASKDDYTWTLDYFKNIK